MPATVKMMTLIARRPDLSRAEFRAYYEEQHVPLVIALIPALQRADYRRNYVAEIHGPESGIDYDVITEVTFGCTEDHQEVMAALGHSSIGARIEADEERFMDRAKMRTVRVDEQAGARSTEGRS